MNEWRTTVEKALKDFVTVAALSQSPILLEDLVVEFLEAPHKPPTSLPEGKIVHLRFLVRGRVVEDRNGGLQVASAVH